MSPISYDDAYAQTNPNRSDEERERSANAIVAGTAAQEAYWNSRGTIEQLTAQASGHAVVQRGEDTEPPNAVNAPAGVTPAVEGTSEDVPPPQVGEGSNPTEDKLREQLKNAGIEPEA